MKVFIQNEAGSKIKRYHNEKSLELLGTKKVSRPYPFPYGFVLHTTAQDGLNVDCFVLTDTALAAGQIVDCIAVGLMEQFEDGKADHNVLAVLPDEPQTVDGVTRSILTALVTHVFDNIPGKSILTGKFRGARAAKRHVARHRDERS